MIEHAVLGVSIVLQFVAAALALHLIRVTGWRVAWSMIAGAMVLMGVRRSITLYHLMLDGSSIPPNLSAEFVALTISVLMVVGAAKIAPVFEASRRNEEALKESEQRFKDFAEIGSDRFWETDAAYRFTHVIDTSENISVPTPQDVLGKVMWKVAGLDPGRDEDWVSYRAEPQGASAVP